MCYNFSKRHKGELGLLREKIKAMMPQVVHHRRYLHQHPELSKEEVQTSAYVAKVLEQMGLQVRRQVGGHGLVVDIKGNRPGPWLLIRGDMDALPIQEETDLDYQSVNPGVMHACGHDIHTSNLIGLAQLLLDHQDQMQGNVRLVFQPAEEGQGGAQAMIDEGILEDQPIQAAIALHVDPQLPIGSAAIEPGPITSYPSFFSLTIEGQGGHGSLPFISKDPIRAGVHFYQLISDLHKELNPLHPQVIQVGAIQAGQAPAVIPNQCVIKGTVRTHYEADCHLIQNRMQEIANTIAQLYQVQVSFDFVTMAQPVINDPDLTESVRQACLPVFDGGLQPSLHFKMVGEDFSAFANRLPACMLLVGCGHPDQVNYPLHHPRFNPHEDALYYGIYALACIAFDYLKIPQ